MKLESFFGPEAQARVTGAVRDAEARSTGQIVPVVVERSAHYHEVRWVGAVLLAALVTAVAEALRLGVTVRELPFLQLAAGVAGALLSRLPQVERILAGKREMAQATRVRALRAFQENDLHHTEKGTGVLVFASLLERRAWVVGDHGIHSRMGDAEWERAAQALVAGIRSGDPASGFCDAIGLVGAKLAEHFPRGAGEGARVNELPDRLVQEKD